MELTEIITQNADKFADITGAADTVTAVIAKAKELGFTVLADNPKEPSYIPKSRLDEVVAQRNELKTQAGELSGQLEKLNAAAKDNEGLQKQIAEMQTKIAEGDKRAQSIAIEAAIKVAAVNAKAKDAADIARFVDAKKLAIGTDGITVNGIDEQLAELAKSKPYLFNADDGGDNKPDKGGGDGFGGDNHKPADLEKQISDARAKGDFATSIMLTDKLVAMKKK